MSNTQTLWLCSVGSSITRSALGGIFFLFLVSCAEVDSRDLRSSGFYADMQISAAGDNQTDVWVRLTTGSSFDADNIVLSDGDTLRASAAGQQKTLSRISGAYRTTFTSDQGGVDYVVSLERRDKQSMPNSIVQLPREFEITAPAAAAKFNSGDTFNIAWSPSLETGMVQVSYSGACQSSVDGDTTHFGRDYLVVDSGTHSVAVDAVLNVFGEQSQFTTGNICPVEISVERENVGSLDRNYGQGGAIVARQIRKIAVRVTP